MKSKYHDKFHPKNLTTHSYIFLFEVSLSEFTKEAFPYGVERLSFKQCCKSLLQKSRVTRMIPAFKPSSVSSNEAEKKKSRPFQKNPFRSDRPRRFRMRRPRFKDRPINLIHLLPNMLTSLNLACGVGAILFSMDKQFETAAMLILMAAFFDLIDGKVARLVGAASPFGVQLDSLADLVSFGVAPPILLHNLLYSSMSRLGASLVLIYALCCALRLARYNVHAMAAQKKREFFEGLPCPAPACFLAALVLSSLEYEFPLTHPITKIGVHIIMVCLSGLMVSTIPYPDLAAQKLERKHVYQYNVFAVLLFCVAILRFKAVLLLLTGLFVFSGPFNAMMAIAQKKPVYAEIPEKTVSQPEENKTEELGTKGTSN